MNCYDCGEFAFYYIDEKNGLKACENHKTDKMKRSFNRETLLHLYKDIIVGDYEHVNSITKIKFTCSKCKKISEKVYIKFVINTFCRDCSRNVGYSKREKTNIEKYGSKTPIKNKSIKQKKDETMIKLYGTVHALQNKEIKHKLDEKNLKIYGVTNILVNEIIKSKRNNTMMEKYGTINPLQNKEIKRKMDEENMKKYGVKNTFQLDGVKLKSKNTIKARYNVDHHLQLSEIREKTKNTNMIRYGKEFISQVPEFKEKAIQTNLQKYGTKNPVQNINVKKKIVETNLIRYGTIHPAQNPEISEKSLKSSFHKKEYTLPSGNMITLQGYEPFAMDILLKTYQEDDIITSRKDVPELWYQENNKNRRHFVDFYIPSINKCIEVKSNWTYKLNPDKIFSKKKSAEEQGYAYEIWIFDKDQTLKVVC